MGVAFAFLLLFGANVAWAADPSEAGHGSVAHPHLIPKTMQEFLHTLVFLGVGLALWAGCTRFGKKQGVMATLLPNFLIIAGIVLNGLHFQWNANVIAYISLGILALSWGMETEFSKVVKDVGTRGALAAAGAIVPVAITFMMWPVWTSFGLSWKGILVLAAGSTATSVTLGLGAVSFINASVNKGEKLKGKFLQFKSDLQLIGVLDDVIGVLALGVLIISLAGASMVDLSVVSIDSNLAKGLTAGIVLLTCGAVWLFQKLRCEKQGWTINPWLLVLISIPAMVLGGASLSAIVAVYWIGVVWNVYGWSDEHEEEHMVEEAVEKLQGYGLSQIGYFIMVGGLIAPSMLQGGEVWGLALLLLIPDLVGKYLGADTPARKIMGYDKRYGRLLGILMGIHGEVKIEVGIVAYFSGLIDETTLSAVVISSLITVAIPYVVGFLYFKSTQETSSTKPIPMAT